MPKKNCNTCTQPSTSHILIGVLVIVLFLLGLWYYKRRSDEGFEDDHLYENVYNSSKTRSSHPTLKYQREASYMNTPANWGDPIRIPQFVGPAYEGSPGDHSRTSGYSYKRAYAAGDRLSGIDGPPTFAGLPVGVPVQAGNFKRTNEIYRGPFYPPSYQNTNQFNSLGGNMGDGELFPRIDDLKRLERPLSSSDYFRPYGPNQPQDISVADTPFYRRGDQIPPSGFFGSSNSYYPFPEVNTPWEKIGLLTTVNPSEDTILNLYRRPIAPLQDLFEYTTQDKNGFVIPLEQRSLIENDDIIERVRGYENKGPWRANVFVNNKYIWV